MPGIANAATPPSPAMNSRLRIRHASEPLYAQQVTENRARLASERNSFDLVLQRGRPDRA
jgi:hypothetical protein